VAKGRPLDQILLYATPRDKHGGAYGLVMAARRADWLEFVERYPQLKTVVDRPWPRGWIPVLVTRETFAGIRWLAIRDDADPRARPESATDYRSWSTRRAAR
jgi:hypothetical protein